MPGDRIWHTIYLAQPSVEFVRTWFVQHAQDPDPHIWLLSLDCEMTRTTRLDKDFREVYSGTPLADRFTRIFPKIIDTNKPTVYIPPTHLLFHTAITPGERYNLQGFINDVECVKELQAQYPPYNEFYINKMEVLFQQMDEKFNIALFKKDTKPESSPVKQALLQGGLVGNTMMPVDLCEIHEDVQMKIRARQGRGRSYTQGQRVLKKHVIQSDPGEARRLLPVLFDGAFLLVRTCRGDLKDEHKAMILACDVAR